MMQFARFRSLFAPFGAGRGQVGHLKSHLTTHIYNP